MAGQPDRARIGQPSPQSQPYSNKTATQTTCCTGISGHLFFNAGQPWSLLYFLQYLSRNIWVQPYADRPVMGVGCHRRIDGVSGDASLVTPLRYSQSIISQSVTHSLTLAVDCFFR